MNAFEAKYSCELLAKGIEKTKLFLAETHREKIADNFKVQLPGNAEDLKDLSTKMENEIAAIEEHIKIEEARYMPVPMDDPSYNAAVNAGSILFDGSIIEDMRECLKRINECLAFIEGLPPRTLSGPS